MTPLTRLARVALVVGVVAGLASGCDGTPARERGADPEPSGAGVEVVTQPHFRGELPVVVQAARPVYSDDACTEDGDPDDDRVCDVSGTESYLLVGDGVPAVVEEARMDLAEGGTSWTVSVRFRPEDRRPLHRIRELARDSGAAVAVLGPADEVLVAADVTRVEGRTISLSGLRKPTAWDLVERYQR